MNDRLHSFGASLSKTMPYVELCKIPDIQQCQSCLYLFLFLTQIGDTIVLMSYSPLRRTGIVCARPIAAMTCQDHAVTVSVRGARGKVSCHSTESV